MTQKEGLVLVVEDNGRNRRLLYDVLASAGYSVLLTATGEEGLDVATGITPDVVLLDIGLPNMDGFEVLRHLRELPSMNGVPIVAVTSYVDGKSRQRIAAEGFDALIAKPFDVDAVTEAIRSALRPRETDADGG